jgi:hypothetical protein
MTAQIHEDDVGQGSSYTEQTRRLDRDRGGAWVGGLVLIALGGFFLLRNITGFALDNWWALFLFIPLLTLGARAYAGYREKGVVDAATRGALTGALIPAAIGVIFLFELNFAVLWPVILILSGLAALVNAGVFRREQ